MSKEERRALAIAKLSKAFGGKGGRQISRGGEDDEDEREALHAILSSVDIKEVHRIARVC